MEQVTACIENAATNTNIEPLLSRQISGGRPQISPENKVLMTLWYITGQEPYSQISDRSNISESTACDATRIVLQTIHDFLTTKSIK